MAEAAEIFNAEIPAYRLVDDIPEVAAEREAVRAFAWEALERRRREGTGVGAPELIPVDPLSTAHHTLAAEQQHGRYSPERAERWDGLVLDCQRLVGEWYRKLKPERFEPLRHIFDPESGDFFSHGLSIRQMTENALVPMSDMPEEEGRRVNERVEDATPQIMRRLGKIAIGTEAIRTISECTDWAIERYQADQKAGLAYQGYGGYVPEKEKIMIRDIRLDAETNDRFEEQVGLPGEWITDDILKEALRRRQVTVDNLSKTERHGAQMLVRDSLKEFVALLDQVASEEWCTNIFMGEEVSKDFVKDYDAFWRESLERRDKLLATSETVAVFVLDLAADGVDKRDAVIMVEDFVKKLLLEIGKESRTIAEQMFDSKTAEGLQEVVALERSGRYEEAYERMREVEQAAPGGGYCGGGSCGLESVNTRSKEGQKLAKRLGVTSSDTVVKDKVRACRRCQAKSIVYAYNSRKVTKLCGDCGAFENNITA